jgi:hypothetical protein
MIKYGDKVRVKSGFFEDMEGKAIDVETQYLYPDISNIVEVELTKNKGFDIFPFTKKFFENELEKIEE